MSLQIIYPMSSIKNSFHRFIDLQICKSYFMIKEAAKSLGRGRVMELLYIFLLIMADQLTKLIAKINLYPDVNIDLISGYLSLTYLENRGAAFGIFKNKKFFLIGLTSIVIAFMIYYLLKNKDISKYMKISLILIISGAIGNLIDRITKGYVVDFIHFYIKNIFDWPVFNVADIFVVCGTILLGAIILLSKE
ncbi:signal peptidase II [Caloramator quimbayensis]|uniref:Lipoprotein signal peptidase n=2 Tax=Caloramator quimbayensis TaxID=1147123 RepID=A0A1T4X1Y8_9CLOT|nr:signal peptidase II [Caloramator quimbayensis]